MTSINFERLEILKEEFDYCEKLGSGKFGSVFRVICKTTGAVFAAKHVLCRRASEKTRLVEEVNILRSLDHPNIMKLYRAFKDEESKDDEVVLILEYLSGGDLYSRVMFTEDITEVDIAGFVRQILSGLEYLHSLNIVHLDLKPENIVCHSKNGFHIKIVDFGLCKQLNNSEDVCVMQGTADFVSPEVINYEPISLGSDMWSVGVITYVLLSGLSPFLGNSNIETYDNITSCNYTLDEEQFDNVSSEGKNFVRTLLVLDPALRPTAEECLSHPWITKFQIEGDNTVKDSTAKLRWAKYGNTIKALKRFRGVEKEV